MFYRKWKIKNVVDVQSVAHLEAFLIKQDVLLCTSVMFYACAAESCGSDHTPHMLKLGGPVYLHGRVIPECLHIKAVHKFIKVKSLDSIGCIKQRPRFKY